MARVTVEDAVKQVGNRFDLVRTVTSSKSRKPPSWLPLLPSPKAAVKSVISYSRRPPGCRLFSPIYNRSKTSQTQDYTLYIHGLPFHRCGDCLVFI